MRASGDKTVAGLRHCDARHRRGNCFLFCTRKQRCGEVNHRLEDCVEILAGDAFVLKRRGGAVRVSPTRVPCALDSRRHYASVRLCAEHFRRSPPLIPIRGARLRARVIALAS